jgi:hypothetical protein
MKAYSKFIIYAVIIILALVYITPVQAQSDFDVLYIDPNDDVKEFSGVGSANSTDHDDIDIVYTESKKAMIKQDIVFKIQVAGIIQVDEDFAYGLYILDGDSEVYVAVFTNGTCIGINFESSELVEDILLTTGENTDTLQITIPIKNIGIIDQYDFYAFSSEYHVTEEDFFEYLDYAPDQEDDWTDWDTWEEKFLFITEPVNGSTVYGISEISGIVYIDEFEIEYLEVQIDTSYNQGWDRADTSDNWETWNYQWDTTSVSDGMHTIRSRAFDGEGYYYDNITVYVDQTSSENPDSSGLSKLNVGDIFEYNMVSYIDPASADIIDDASISGKMTMKVDDTKSITINGSKYDVYKVTMDGKITMDYGVYSLINKIDGYTYHRISDLAIVKEDLEMTSSMSGFGFSENFVSEEVTVYDPPAAKFKFPLTVGEHWQTTAFVTTESSYSDSSSDSSDTETDTYESSLTYICECLRTETIVVPAGIFETYLVYIAEDYDDSWLTEDEFDGREEEDNEGSVGVGYYSDSSGGYSIEYYSPELGYIIKTETYDENRKIIMSVELVSYDHETPGSKSSSSGGAFDFGQGFQISNELCIIVIIIFILTILSIILLIRRRNRKLDEMVIAKYAASPNQVQSQPVGLVAKRSDIPKPQKMQHQPDTPTQTQVQTQYKSSQYQKHKTKQQTTNLEIAQEQTTSTKQSPGSETKRSYSMTTARIQSAKPINNLQTQDETQDDF